MKYEKAINKISNIIITLLILIIVLTAFQINIIFSYRDLKVKSYEKTLLNINKIEYTITKEKAKEFIDKLYNTPHFYIETNNLNQNINGKSNIFFRIVYIKKELDLIDYITTYSHELTHIKYQVADETFTTYMTFVILYESGNEEFKNAALIYARTILCGGYAGTEYDCGYYILKYLKNI